MGDKHEAVAQRFDDLIPELEKTLKHCQIATDWLGEFAKNLGSGGDCNG